MNPRLEAEKAALIQRAELERLGIEAAWLDARKAVLPPTDPIRRAGAHTWLGRALRVAVPMFGIGRVSRAVQLMTVGLAVFRIARNWK
ncbi:MAG TPA: hypothetical protein VN789_08960 [Casimicrobiaceae bacterium]|nr:hypothetical protein [Casimicrobiaceae bacterium]